jgi:plastocyanin
MANRRKKSQRKQTGRKRWKTSRILTWAGLGCLAAAIVVLTFFAVTGGEAEPGRKVRQKPVVSEEPRVTIEVVDNDFEPNDLTVRPGTEVVWEFKGNAAHDVTDAGGAFASGTLNRGDEFVMTFEEPGAYYYYCTLHHSMLGTLIVELARPTPTP